MDCRPGWCTLYQGEKGGIQSAALLHEDTKVQMQPLEEGTVESHCDAGISLHLTCSRPAGSQIQHRHFLQQLWQKVCKFNWAFFGSSLLPAAAEGAEKHGLCWRLPATLKSQASASSAPPPSATPSTIATLGMGSACRSGQQGVNFCSSRTEHCLHTMSSSCSADLSTLQTIAQPHATQLQQLDALASSMQTMRMASQAHDGQGACSS